MEYNGKKALVCGMARSGIAAAKLLNRLGARVTLQDMKKREEISADVLALEGEGIVLYTGANPDEIACAQDFNCIKPRYSLRPAFYCGGGKCRNRGYQRGGTGVPLDTLPDYGNHRHKRQNNHNHADRRNHENGLQRYGGCRKHWSALQRGGRAADRKGLGGCGNQQLPDGKGEGISSAY